MADKKSKLSLHSCSMRKRDTSQEQKSFSDISRKMFSQHALVVTSYDVLHLHYQDALRSRTFAPAFFEFFEAVNSSAFNTSCVLFSFLPHGMTSVMLWGLGVGGEIQLKITQPGLNTFFPYLPSLISLSHCSKSFCCLSVRIWGRYKGENMSNYLSRFKMASCPF